MDTKPVTLGQTSKLLTLMNDKGVTSQRLNDLFASGILADLFDEGARISPYQRDEVRAAIGMGSPLKRIRTLSLTSDTSKVIEGLKGVETLSARSPADYNWMAALLPRVAKLKRERAKIIMLTLEELDLPEGTLFENACKRGIEMGYQMCPPEIAIQIPLQEDGLADWPPSAKFNVMMELPYDRCRLYFQIGRNYRKESLGTKLESWNNPTLMPCELKSHGSTLYLVFLMD